MADKAYDQSKSITSRERMAMQKERAAAGELRKSPVGAELEKMEAKIAALGAKLDGMRITGLPGQGPNGISAEGLDEAGDGGDGGAHRFIVEENGILYYYNIPATFAGEIP